MPFTLILGWRRVGAGKDGANHYYIGFYLLPDELMTEDWLSRWQAKVAERGDYGAA